MNINIPLYNSEGKSETSLTLKTNFDNLKLNHNLISQLVYAYQSNERVVISHTKRRSEVSGTGKKPYKQKGTGYARFGSLRTPIHRGGGVAFGPKKDKNFKKKINKSVKCLALAQVVNAKNTAKEIFAIENFDVKKPNTKNFIASIPKIKFKDGNMMILCGKYDKALYLSTRNLPSVNLKIAKDVNIMDILTHDNLVVTRDGIDALQNQFIPSKSVVKENNA